MMRRFLEPLLGRILIPHLAVAQHNDAHQGPLALRVLNTARAKRSR